MLPRADVVDRLDPSDWLLIGYLLGLVVIYIAQEIESTPTDTATRTWTEQDVHLSEDHLQRLEDGETVRVSRWHGHDLVLNGAIVVGDVEEESDD